MPKGKFALGVLIGAAIGYLTAPKAGKETRADLKAKADDLKKEASKKSTEVKKEVDERLEDVKDAAEKASKEAKVAAEKAKAKAEVTAEDLRKKAEDYKTRGEHALRGAIDGAKKGFDTPPKK